MTALLLLCLPAVGGWADVFKLPNGAQLELFPVGRWKIATEDIGEFRIVLVPQDEHINARAVFSLAFEGSDDFPTEERLQRQIHRVAERFMASGEVAERRPVVKPLYPPKGFGYYTLLTDRKLVGRPPVPGEFKMAALGMIRLAPAVMWKIQVMADGEETPEFQQLLGMAEGALYTPR